MEHFCHVRVVTVFLLVFVTRSVTAEEQINSVPSVCSPQNPDCYFERFGNFKIPQVEPVKASMIKLKFLTLTPLILAWTSLFALILRIVEDLRNIKLAKINALVYNCLNLIENFTREDFTA